MPVKVAIAPASSSRTSSTTRSSESGSSLSRNAPPETGGISATSSPSASARSRGRVLLVDRVEQAARLVAEVERGPHVGDAWPPRSPAATSRRARAGRRTGGHDRHPTGYAETATSCGRGATAAIRTARAYFWRGRDRPARDRVRNRGEAGLHGRRRADRARAARRVSVHARPLPRHVPRPAVDDPAVRRLRVGRGVERALPLPARARPDGALDRVRPADAARLRLRRSARARRGRPHRRRDRLARRHGDAARRHPARRGLDVDDDQRAGGAPAAPVRAGRRGAGRSRRPRCAAPCRTTSSRSTSRAGTTSSRRARRCG